MAAISYSCNTNGTACQGTSTVDQTSFQRLQELLNQLAQRLGIRDRTPTDGVIGEQTMTVLQAIAIEVPRLPLSACWAHSVRDIARDAPQLMAATQLELSSPAPGGRPPRAEAPAVGPAIVYAPPAPFAPNTDAGAPGTQTSATAGFVSSAAGPYLAAIFGVLALGGVAIFALKKKRKSPDEGQPAMAAGMAGARRQPRDDQAWRRSPRGTAAYEVAKAAARKQANETGRDYGIEANDLFHTWNVFLLPTKKHRTGHELRAEVVSCDFIDRCQPGYGPLGRSLTRGRGLAGDAPAGWNFEQGRLHGRSEPVAVKNEHGDRWLALSFDRW